MRTPLVAAVLLAFALSLTAAGCGGDSGSSSTETSHLSAKEWRSRANAICRDIGRKVRTIPRPKSLDDVTPFVAATLPLWRQQEDRISAIGPPQRIAASARDYLQSLSYFEAALVEIQIATERSDGTRRAEAVDKSLRWADYMRQGALSIGGLPACVQERVP